MRRSGAAVALALVVVGSSLAAFAYPLASMPARGGAPGAEIVPPAPNVRSTSSTPAQPIALSPEPSRVAVVDQARAATLAATGKLSDFFPPNLNAPPPLSATNGHVVPLYSEAPAPMGIGVFGLRNSSGTVTPYVLNTTSVQGTFSTGDPYGVRTYWPDYEEIADDDATDYGSQLNAVLTNVTLFGQGGYEFWLQDVVNYDPALASEQLSLEDNIWNFSSMSMAFPSHTLLSYTCPDGGGIFGSTFGGYYGCTGPSFTVGYPFSVALYLNTTISRLIKTDGVWYGQNRVYFNYSVWSGSGTNVGSGDFDEVTFASTTGSLGRVPFGSAEIQANGEQYNPIQLTNDIEMTWGIGADDGGTSSVTYANATLGLYYLNGTTQTWESPPSASDFGGDTGETAMGEYGSWKIARGQPVEWLTSGPSLLVGLWNLSSTGPGAYPLSYSQITPGNAWVAVAYGSEVADPASFQVAPTFGYFAGRGRLGTNIYLSPGYYTVEVMLSGYANVSATVDLTSGPSTPILHLVRTADPEVFTPEWAFSSQDLANLSVGGSGTAGSPYLLFGAQGMNQSLSPVFGGLNDYLFTVWVGVWINSTSAHAEFDPAPTMFIAYPPWQFSGLEKRQAPDTNQYSYYLYHVQDLSIIGSPGIGGWVTSQSSVPIPSAEVIGGRSVLFADDFFNVSCHGLDLEGGGSGAYVWNSTFYPWPNSTYAGIQGPSLGLSVSESGVWAYDDAFYTNGTATGASGTTAYWNVSGRTQPVGYVRTVNGFSLTGRNILGQPFQGGDFWQNYGNAANPYGVRPYVGRLASPVGTPEISSGGDYAPLSAYGTLGAGLYSQLFQESALPTGSSWTMRVYSVPVALPLTGGTTTSSPSNATTTSASSTANGFWLPNGTYRWAVVASPAHHTALDPSGTLSVDGGAAPILISFATGYSTTFTESGLAPGTEWYVNISEWPPLAGSSSSLTTLLPNGTFTYAVGMLRGWQLVSGSYTGSISVSGTAPAPIVLAFAPVSYPVVVTESGLGPGVVWGITIAGSTNRTSASALDLRLGNGTYPYTILPIPGWELVRPSYEGSLSVAGAPASLALVFLRAMYELSFAPEGLPGGESWTVALNGSSQSADAPSAIAFFVPNGTFAYAVRPIPGYSAPWNGSARIDGSNASVSVVFALVRYALVFEENGLPNGTNWSVSLNGSWANSTVDAIAFSVANGSYPYAVGPVPGFYVTSGGTNGTVQVSGPPTPVVLDFARSVYPVTFEESGLSSGTVWTVRLGNLSQSTTGTSLEFVEPNGTYSYGASAPGYTSDDANGTVRVDGSAQRTVVDFVASGCACAASGLPITTLALVGGAIAAAAIAVAVFAVRRRRA